MSITINLEIGHDASLRTKTTPEGFTHDWEVYVKGCNGAEIHYFVEKVVFHLHETFPKPKRVVKEPPYALRTSGYAGFNLPIEIYLKNNQEPKKIRFNYDLQLQPRGPPIHNVQKEKYVFHSPSEEFRSKLLKGGGIVGSQGSTQDIGDSKAIDDKNQMTSKPKLSGAEVPKKHKNKPDEPRTTDFLNLFGTPITKTSKAPEPPKPKEVPKNFPKLDKQVDKDKTKTKNPYKDKEKEKPKDKEKSSDSSEKKKEEKKKSKEDKSKDRDRVKEKSSKKDKEREKSPSARPRSPSPKRSPKRPPSPPPQKHSSSKEKETSKEERKDKDRKDEKKNKKDKREHKESKHKDRDKEHKEHKSRDSKSSKDSSSASLKEEANPTPNNVAAPQLQQKSEKKEKSKESVKESKDEEKSEKSRSDKSEDKQKHKHKKKDRKEKREDKYSSKTEKKSEKPPTAAQPVKEEPKELPPVSSSRDTDKSNLFGSPKSEPPSTPNQTDPKDKSTNNLTFKEEEISNDSLKVSSRESSPQRAPVKSPSQPPPEPVKKVEPEKKKEESSKKKDKKEKKKDKKSDRDHEKRRKRKSPQSHQEVEPPEKVLKEEENNNSDDERKVSSTEDAKPLPNNDAEDYMGMLRDLQHKIMGLKDNSDLQKVVQLIAETGRYEVSAHTFDFDLCLLDRSTVRQLQDFFASIS